MAKCKRCGAVFDYDQKDGVCPKCCFYNRPPGMPERDTEWISTYNFEENTYQLPKSIIEQEEEHKSIFHRTHFGERKKYTSEKDCHVEGSHVHVEKRRGLFGSKNVQKERKEEAKRAAKASQAAKRTGQKDGAESALKVGRIIGITFFAIILLSILISFLFLFISDFDFFNSDSKKNPGNGETETFEIRGMSVDEISKGAAIGDMTYSVDPKGALVFMHQGDIPEIPKGEKCIAIHLTTNESALNYDGVDWMRPYVYDGKNYRDLVDGLVMGSHNLPQTQDNNFMYRYLSPTSNEDFDGLATYFVDEKAETVTLCIPEQTVENDAAVLKGVVEITLPVNEISQEGGKADGQ